MRRYTSTLTKNNSILLCYTILQKVCTLMHSPEEEATPAGASSTWRLMSAQWGACSFSFSRKRFLSGLLAVSLIKEYVKGYNLIVAAPSVLCARLFWGRDTLLNEYYFSASLLGMVATIFCRMISASVNVNI